MDRRKAALLIPEIYKATVDSDHWNHVLELMADITKSGSALLYFYDKSLGAANTLAYHGCMGGTLPDFDGYFSQLNSLFDKEFSVADKGRTLSEVFFADGAHLIGSSEGELKKDVNYHLGRIQFINDDKHKAAIAILRQEDQGPWCKGEIRLFEEIVPHLKRAFDIHSEFTRLRFQQNALLNGLDRLVIGLILYDENAHVIYVNPAAGSIISSHPALSINDDGLVLNNRAENKKLHQIILDTARIDPENSWKQSVAIGVTHPDVEAPLPLLVTPIHATEFASNLDYEGAKVAVFLSDPGQLQPISVPNLVSVYELTPSEARVAIGIANGESIADIANTSNLSSHTVRSHLKAIFKKTGVTRQNELIKLLLTGPFAHRRRSS